MMENLKINERTKRITRSLPVLNMPSLITTDNRSKRTKRWIRRRNNVFTYIASAFYAKVIVILGIALPITDSIATEDYQSYDGFYLYLYLGSIGFLIYTYVQHLRAKSNPRKDGVNKGMMNDYFLVSSSTQYGSFYFRMGVAGFGIGSIIYSGLQFGQYFELSSEKDCVNILKALIPLFRITFSLMQMLFIFSYSNFLYNQTTKVISLFGIMHMIATNLSEWLLVLVQETKNDIFRSVKRKQTNGTLSVLDYQFINSKSFLITKQFYMRNLECLDSKIMQSILEKVEPYLAPCSVEYSFLCVVILGLMWKNACNNLNGKNRQNNEMYPGVYHKINTKQERRYVLESSSDNQTKIKEKQSGYNVIEDSRQNQFSVDCAQAHKGLFSGILVLAMTIISLIMFFELVSYKQYKDAAILQVNIWETILFVTGTLAAVSCINILRDVEYKKIMKELELEHLLLLVTQTGVFMYFLFQIIGGALMGVGKGKGWLIRIITPICALIQSSCQTVLIMDAWKRRCATLSHYKTKPGRQLITFLLVANIALWIVNRVKNNHAFSHPNQMEFYGVLAWNIITHVTMPLVVSYRFQSTVCFYEIWKRVYKLSPIDTSIHEENFDL